MAFYDQDKTIKKGWIITWLCALLMLIVSVCKSEELLILTENLPPLNYMEDGQLVGPSVEIVKEIQKRVGSFEPIKLYPWARAYKIALERENVVLFGTSYTPNRQNLFKWVGPLAVKRDILIARKDARLHIASLEDAKLVNGIGTLRDDTRQEFLMEMGFTNLQAVSDDKQNAQKLAIGRIDLWAYKHPGMNTLCRLAGVDPDLFTEVLDLRQVEVSIAFSRKTSDSIVDRWRQAFEAMEEDGTIEEIRSRWQRE